MSWAPLPPLGSAGSHGAGAYVEAMGRFWRECNGRSAAEKLSLPHRECMRARMPEARAAEMAVAARAGLRLQPPTLMRAVYGSYEPALLVLLRLPWERMHAAYYNYVHYRNRRARAVHSASRPARPCRLPCASHAKPPDSTQFGSPEASATGLCDLPLRHSSAAQVWQGGWLRRRGRACMGERERVRFQALRRAVRHGGVRAAF